MGEQASPPSPTAALVETVVEADMTPSMFVLASASDSSITVASGWADVCLEPELNMSVKISSSNQLRLIIAISNDIDD